MKFIICLTILVALLAVSVHSLPSKESMDSDDSVAHDLASHTNFKDSETVHSLLLKSMKKILDRDTRQAKSAPAPQAAVDPTIEQLKEYFDKTVGEKVDKRIEMLNERITKLEKLTTSTGYAVSPSGQHGDGIVVIQLGQEPNEITGGAYPLGQVQPANSNGVFAPNTRANYLYRN